MSVETRWHSGDGERRAEDDRRHLFYHQEKEPSAMSKHIGNILQAVIILGLGAVVTSVLSLREGAIRIDARSESTGASISRIEADISLMRKQLQLTDSAIQAGQFRLDDHERRLKGLELMKERNR